MNRLLARDHYYDNYGTYVFQYVSIQGLDMVYLCCSNFSNLDSVGPKGASDTLCAIPITVGFGSVQDYSMSTSVFFDIPQITTQQLSFQLRDRDYNILNIVAGISFTLAIDGKNLWAIQKLLKWKQQFQKIRSLRTRPRSRPLQQPRPSPSRTSRRPREGGGGLLGPRTRRRGPRSPGCEWSQSPRRNQQLQRLRSPTRSLQPILWHRSRLVPLLLSLLPLAPCIARLLLSCCPSGTP